MPIGVGFNHNFDCYRPIVPSLPFGTEKKWLDNLVLDLSLWGINQIFFRVPTETGNENCHGHRKVMEHEELVKSHGIV